MGAAQFTPEETIDETCKKINDLVKYIETHTAESDQDYIVIVKRVIEQHEAHLVQQCKGTVDPQLEANRIEVLFECGRIPEAAAPPYKAALKALQDRIAAATGKPYEPDERGKQVYRIKEELKWLDFEIMDLTMLIRRKSMGWMPPEMPVALEEMKRRQAYLIEELAKRTSSDAGVAGK